VIMDISVIIVNYKTKKETLDAVNSCLTNTSRLKKEIIVVDNGSADGSYAYLSKKLKNKPSVVLIKGKMNLGFAKAVNLALKRSKGEYRLLLNSDTRVTNNCFKRLIDFAKTDKTIGVIGTKLILPNGSIQDSCFNFPGIVNALKEYWFGLKGSYSPFYKNRTSQVDAVVGASFLITPKAFQKVGLFDERYFMYFEDIDYCRRVKKAGLKVIYYPEVEIFHYHGLSGKGLTEASTQWRRLIPSSVIYHGRIRYEIINFILWSGQLWKRIIKSKI